MIAQTKIDHQRKGRELKDLSRRTANHQRLDLCDYLFDCLVVHMSSKEGRQDANAVMFNFWFVLFVRLDKNDPRNHMNKVSEASGDFPDRFTWQRQTVAVRSSVLVFGHDNDGVSTGSGSDRVSTNGRVEF